MISINDTTILAMLSRFPDMPADEADRYIAQIEHEENIQICHAVIGRIAETDLSDHNRVVLDEFKRWSIDRTRRVRHENWDARRRQRETHTATRMNQLHRRGVISDEMLMLYGISGELPERTIYEGLSSEEKERFWSQRMEERFGPNWRDLLQERVRMSVPTFQFRKVGALTNMKVNWKKEGF